MTRTLDAVRTLKVLVALVTAFVTALVALDGADTSEGSLDAQVEPAPERFNVRLDTSRGDIVIAVEKAWAPRGAERFYVLVRQRYYDDARFFRVVAGRWAQFGIHKDPAAAQAWRGRTFPDDPRVASNTRGAVAFAWAVRNGRTTQVFINLGDNSSALDAQGFAPFGRVAQGMEAADALYAGYGEESGGGIRAGRQGPLFELGNAYLLERFPRLDYIRRAIIEEP